MTIAENIVDILLESPEFKTLKKNKQPLTPEEKAQVMKAGATWNNGPNGEPSSAVWKAIVNGKTWYVCSTHRVFQCRPSLKGAIGTYDQVETTA